jgi:hypothetical protein
VQNLYLQAISVNLEKFSKIIEIIKIIEMFVIKAFQEFLFIIETAQFLKTLFLYFLPLVLHSKLFRGLKIVSESLSHVLPTPHHPRSHLNR